MRPFSTSAGAIAGAFGAITIAAGAVSGPAVAEAQGTTTLDMRVSDRSLVVGQAARVSGRVGNDLGGRTLTLEFRPHSRAAWIAIATTTVAPGGTYRFARGLQRSGSLRVVLQPGDGAATASSGSTQSSEVTVALAPRVAIGSRRLHVKLGSRATVAGRVAPGVAGLRVRLDGFRGGAWRPLARARTTAGGRYVLRERARSTGSLRVRVVVAPPAGLTAGRKALGRLNVYRMAHVSWYGPGFYGRRTGCGGRLGYSQLGVAHKSLPCGTLVTLRHRGRSVRVPVMDRGPYVGGREYDLTAMTARRIGFRGHGPILVTR